METDTGRQFRKIADELFNGKLGDLAEALGMHPGSFSKYTAGKTMPGGKILRRLIALDVNINWFLADVPPMLISDLEANPEDSQNGTKLASSANGKTTSQSDHMTYYADISESDLSHSEKNLLEEVKQFSDFLENRPLHPHAKRILLEQLIQSIDQELERRQP